MMLALVGNGDCSTELELGDQIAELSAHIDAATYRLLVLIAEFDACNGWDSGFASCAHWLNWRTGLDLGAARERVRVARALPALPRLSEGLRSGRLSYSKVRALTRVATPENEEELLSFATSGTAEHVEKLVRLWRRADRNEEQQEDERRHENRSLSLFVDEDGMFVIRGRLTPEVGAALQQSLDAARDALYREAEDNDASTPAQRNADAIGLVAEGSLHAAPERHQIVVHVDASVLESDAGGGQVALEAGARVSAETSRRLACDGNRVEMRHGKDGSVLDVGRRTRVVPTALRRALENRDRTCRFPGCASRFCDAHHIEHWGRGGETKLDNLVLLCRRHHRAVHEEGFGVALDADGQPHFRRPDRRPIPNAPPSPRVRNSDDCLRRTHNRLGLKIEPRINFPEWDGSPVDWGLAIETLRPSSRSWTSTPN